ncbi:MAG: TetR/AcrR family transcriptional regulator [Calditrichaceae bacterium]|nr:TetR/AcrR family transcriptional regulator [Calditrichaceae bacterium]
MGISERRERDRERRKNEIIDAAENIFFRNGFENSSVEKVAEAAELSKATLYLYFKSKEELYYAVCQRAEGMLFEKVDKAIKKATDTSTKIRAFLNAFVEFQQKNKDHFDALFYLQTHPFKLDPDNELMIENRRRDQIYINHWTELIDQGKKEGLIRDSLDPIRTVLLIWMQLSGLLKIASVWQCELHKELGFSRDELLDEYYNILFNGIKRDKQ